MAEELIPHANELLREHLSSPRSMNQKRLCLRKARRGVGTVGTWGLPGISGRCLVWRGAEENDAAWAEPAQALATRSGSVLLDNPRMTKATGMKFWELGLPNCH